MKKLLDYDWLRAVQFKCSTSALVSFSKAEITLAEAARAIWS